MLSFDVCLKIVDSCAHALTVREERWRQVQVIPYSNHEAAQRTKVYDPPSSPPHPALPLPPPPPPPPLSLRETSLSLSIYCLFFLLQQGLYQAQHWVTYKNDKNRVKLNFSAFFMMSYQPPMSTLSAELLTCNACSKMPSQTLNWFLQTHC